MSPLRVFIAIELSQQTLDAIEKQTARLRQTVGDEIIRWVPPQNMHLTLKFIGDIAPSHLDFLKQMITREAATHPQFEMQIGGLGSFPNSRMPRILWVGLHAPAVLTSLHKSIETGASRLGYEKEERAVAPQRTLGRARHDIKPGELAKVRTALDTIQLGNIATARVDSVHLFKSDLQSGGSVYTKLFSAPLSKP